MSKREIKARQRQEWRSKRQKRKTIRHNTAANQEKHRADWQPLEPDAFGVVPDRRIMPRDEITRRLRVEHLAGEAIQSELSEREWAAMAGTSPYELGIVTATGRGVCHVQVGGVDWLCDIRGRLIAEGNGQTTVVAAGDRVLVQTLENGRGLIEEVLPRRSGLARQDPFYSHLTQVIAANVDQLLIVASWREPALWLALVDEYLIAAARNNLEAIICVNKVDLAEDLAKVSDLLQPYRELGYTALLASATTGYGLEALETQLRRKTTVLAGLSGVGKSSLISAIDPDLDLKTNRINEQYQEGRHTTTQSVLLPLVAGGFVVDTPGIREMGLNGLRQEDLLDFYPDLLALTARCRFADCTHSHEPGCAVKQAVDRQELAAWRLENYHKLYAELPAG